MYLVVFFPVPDLRFDNFGMFVLKCNMISLTQACALYSQKHGRNVQERGATKLEESSKNSRYRTSSSPHGKKRGVCVNGSLAYASHCLRMQQKTTLLVKTTAGPGQLANYVTRSKGLFEQQWRDAANSE